MFAKSFKKLLIVSAILLSGLVSRAQSGAFTIEFIDQKAETQNTGIIDAYVKIKNISGTAIEGEFDAHSSHEDLYLVQRKSKTITLSPQDSTFIPVKALIATTATAGNQCTIEAAFTTKKGQTQSAFLPVTIAERKLVKMFLPEPDLIYENIGDHLDVKVQITNEGNTTQNITLITRYPKFVSKNEIESSMVTVKAFSDTTVVIKKPINRDILSQEDFIIAVTSLYSNGDMVGVGTIKASSIKQNRKYTSQFAPDYVQTFGQTNQVTASTQRNSNNINSYYLYANADAQINNSTIYANIDANWWDTSNEIFLRNTWLGYKNDKFGALAGTISKFADLNLIGRGGQAFYNLSENNTIEAGILDKTYNLIDYANSSTGSSAWASYLHNGGWMLAKGYEANVIYDKDSYYGYNNYLGSARAAVLTKENLEVKVGAGVSRTASDSGDETHNGAAAEAIVNGKAGKFYYSSNNFYSTGYYAGIKKGVTNLTERVSLSLNQYNLWLTYSYLSATPKPLLSQNYISDLKNSRYGLGASRRFSNFTVSLNPYFYTEERTETFITSPQEYNMEAARVSLGTSYYNFVSRQSVDLTVEGGLFDSNAMTKQNEFHFKANFNYRWRIFSLYSTYQYNNFSLGEVIANNLVNTGQPTETYYNLSVSPAIDLKFFDDKLSINANVNYSENPIIDRVMQYNGRAEYNFSKTLRAFAYYYYSEPIGDAIPISSFQVGLTKQFSSIKIDRSKSDLEVYVYYETSAKGALAAENSPAADQLIIIDGKAFRTNSQGIVKYRSVPEGDYNIRPMNNNEWHAYSRNVTVKGDTKVAIGLNKTATIKGTLTYISTERSYQISKKTGGLSIIAIDDTGNVFHTRTDENGNFVLYVPKGNYTITLEKNGVSEYVEIENNNQIIEAIPNEIKEIKFNLNIKEKRLETKKFTSRGFPTMSTPDDQKKKKK